ncbi:hypothetical protein B0H10DRAFT_1943120 [Mycena sp. CBHHK59/15]|nr:hypothetical protein B0H10DRAFT_1943120 [Mycena sp. CBHHK59/15]
MTLKMKLSSHLPNFSSGSSHCQHSSNSVLDKTDGTKIRSVDAHTSALGFEGLEASRSRSISRITTVGSAIFGREIGWMQAESFWPGDQKTVANTLYYNANWKTG